MLTSLAFIFLAGMVLSWLFKKFRLPGLLGMIVTGMLLGPYGLNILDAAILSISPDLRKLALIIILTRAGLSLDINDLKKVGRPAVLMCFLPACFEIIGMVIIAPRLLGVSVLDAAIMGAVVGAVSPAVVIPKMLHLMDERYGTGKSIPQMIIAGASVDDVFVIVMFAAFTGLAQGDGVSAADFLQIPISIITGLVFGAIVGIFLAIFMKRANIRDSAKVIIVLSISFLMVALENGPKNIVPFSGLLAVMSLSATLQKKDRDMASRLSSKFSKLWVGAEIILFVLVGATVDLKYAIAAGIPAVLVIFGAIIFRVAGVFLCMVKTSLNNKEKLFCMIAYVPKATVQAAIGSIPLALGLSCGNIVLTVAVLAIIITAPLGALGVDLTYKRLLEKEENAISDISPK